MKRKNIHPMELKVSFPRMNAFYISLLTMKSSIAFGTVMSKCCQEVRLSNIAVSSGGNVHKKCACLPHFFTFGLAFGKHCSLSLQIKNPQGKKILFKLPTCWLSL
jgi:hypothetical protein